MLRTLPIVLIVRFALANSAHADPGTPAPDVIVPPALETFVPAEYPPAAREAGREAAVDLELVVGADGKVVDARVLTPAGDGFDEAAVAAARAFQFRPATRGGVPVAVKIRYRYVFELTTPTAEPPVEPSAPPPPAPGRLEGRVLSRADGEPLIGVDVVIAGAGAERALITDADGRFDAGDLPPGDYEIRIVALEHGELRRIETVASGEAASLVYRLDPIAGEGDTEYGATATVAAPEREITRRTIGAEQLTRLAGTRGDALRVVELLPGIARPPGGAGVIIVRGSSPEDSAVFFEGAPVPNLYHFGGLTSFANGNLLSNIDLYAGNFSTRYGRKIGGIIEVGLRDPHRDRLHGVVDVNLLDASAQVEGPIAGDWSFAAAARRSTVDAWFGSVMPQDVVSVTAAPVYDDYQAYAVWKPGADDRVRLMVYGTRDRFRLEFDQSMDDSDPGKHGTLGMENAAHKAQVDWFHRFSADAEQDLRVNAGYWGISQELGEEWNMDVDAFELVVRDEQRIRLSRRVRLAAGLDISYLGGPVVYRGPQWRQVEGNPDAAGAPIDSLPISTVDQVAHFFRPAAFAEATVTVVDPLEVTAGARVDYFGEIDQVTFDPRATARLALGPATTLKGGVGLFHQPPEYGQAIDGIGDPDLRAVSAMHYTLGVDRRLGAAASVGVDGFYKSLDDLPRNGATDGDFEQVGTGRIYGVELMGRLQPRGPLSGFVSYTLSKSERDDGEGGWRPFDYDQTHILTVGGSWKMGAGWELGGTFRYTTGNPETPVIGAFYNADFDTYTAMYGPVNSARQPAFHRLDVRLEKQFTIGGGRLAAYLDLQNAYNNRSREGTSYNYDYSEQTPIYGLPILPSIGVRGEL